MAAMPGKNRRAGTTGRVHSLLLLVCGLGFTAVLAPAAPVWAMETGPAIESVQVGFPGPMVSHRRSEFAPFKVATWTPVRVDLTGGSQPWRGRVAISAPDSDGTPTISSVAVALEPGERASPIGYVRFGTLEPELSVSLVDEAGMRVGAPMVQSLRQPLGWSTLLVLAAGQTSGLEQLPTLGKFHDAKEGGSGLVVAPWRTLPDRALGLDAVEALVLACDDTEALERLAGAEGAVVRAWVAHGGHLVVSLSVAHWERAGEVLGDLLPARPVGTATLVDLAPVEGFADKVTQQIQQKEMAVVRLDSVDRRALTLAAASASPLVVRGSYGLGKVTLTGVDVATEPFASWPDRRAFWDRMLDIRGRSSDADAAVASTRGALIQVANPDLAARLLQALETFPGIGLIPFGWVASLVFAYLLLIGPVDYLFLKRAMKRMELTWITFPLIVLTTTGLAFGLARSLKGTSLRLNKIDVLDVDPARGVYRGATWFTVFSPGNHDYTLSLVPGGPELRETVGAGAGVAGESALSWFAPPEAGLSGLGRVALGNRKSAYPDDGRLDVLTGERIPIWSTKSFAGRWSGTAGPLALLESTLRTEPGDRASGSIRNRTGRTLRRAQLFYGKNVYELGTIRPDQIARVTSTRSEAIPRALGRFVQEALAPRKVARARRTEVSPPAAGLLRVALFHDAMGSRADVYPSFPLRGFDLSSQVVELHRPVLVAEIEDESTPACEVRLEGAPGAPAVRQMTLVRIVLEMDPPTSSTTPASANSTRPAKPGTPSP